MYESVLDDGERETFSHLPITPTKLKTQHNNNVRKTLYIKGMVCNRCIKVLKEELASLGVTIRDIRLGRVVIDYNPNKVEMSSVLATLKNNDFEILTNREKQITNQIKTMIIDLVSKTDEQEFPKRLSEYLAKKLGFNYSYLSRLFTQHERITIEKYAILIKIEKAKELLEYNPQINLAEVIHKLNYSSVQHLSKQFKEVTGISIKNYKSFLKHLRSPLDRLLHTHP